MKADAPPRRSAAGDAAHFARSYFSDDPSYAIFFVTAVCNARCRHCFYWREIAAAKASKELTLAEIEKIARSLDRLIYLSIGGGEPFLRPDLAAVVKAFYDRSGILYCNIVTSGFHTERCVAAVREILRGCPRLTLKVQISVDDFRDGHDRNRGVPGMYDHAMETARRLSAEFRRHHRRFALDVATCLTKSNKGHAEDLAAHLRTEVEFDNFSFLYPRGDAEVPAEKDVTAQEYARAVGSIERTEFRRNHASIFGAVHRVARRGVLRVIERDEAPWRCLAGRKFVSITERGVLQPCEMLGQMLPSYDSTLADLRAFDFDVRRALAGDRAKRVVDFIRETDCHCTFECAAMNNVVFDPRNAVEVLRTWVLGGRAEP